MPTSCDFPLLVDAPGACWECSARESSAWVLGLRAGPAGANPWKLDDGATCSGALLALLFSFLGNPEGAPASRHTPLSDRYATQPHPPIEVGKLYQNNKRKAF